MSEALAQRRAALGRAHVARQAQAKTRARIREAPTPAGLLEAARLVDELPDHLAALSVESILTSVRGVRHAACTRLLLKARLLDRRRARLRDLSDLERWLLAAALRGDAERRTR